MVFIIIKNFSNFSFVNKTLKLIAKNAALNKSVILMIHLIKHLIKVIPILKWHKSVLICKKNCFSAT